MYADLYRMTPHKGTGMPIPGTLEEARALVAQTFGEDGHITQMFGNCIQDTLTQTISRGEDGRYFMITGDIPAMWLRDSACQLHFLLPFAARDPELSAIIRGIIARQMDCICIDPYANAFNAAPTGSGEWADDLTDMRPELWERKYEIDSLCYPVQLSYLYWKCTGDDSIFTAAWFEAVQQILETFETEQYHESRSTYRFQRLNCRYQDTLSRDGKGALVKEGIGLIWSGFRPSDDACVYGYLIPSNMFAVVILEYIAEVVGRYAPAGGTDGLTAAGGPGGSSFTEAAGGAALTTAAGERGGVEAAGGPVLRRVGDDLVDLASLGTRAAALAASVRQAIDRYAVLPQAEMPYYAYEVDGYGQYLVMDDANVPSLLAMPYLGYCEADDLRYRNTRKVLLSDANPYYYAGSRLSGIGSVHTEPSWIWPISLAIQGLTSTDGDEQLALIHMIAENDAGTGLVHESIHEDDSARFTRPWFSWANMMFCELVLEYAVSHAK